jgi:hypothetical protein
MQPDLETLFAVEDALEKAWCDILAGHGIAAVHEFSDRLLDTPRVEVAVRQLAPTGHRGEYAPGQFCFDAWQGQMISRVVTVRGRNSAAQNPILGRLRLEAQYFRDRFGVGILPHHCLTSIAESGLVRYIDDENGYDISELSHAVHVSIRPGAWPALG